MWIKIRDFRDFVLFVLSNLNDAGMMKFVIDTRNVDLGTVRVNCEVFCWIEIMDFNNPDVLISWKE